MESPKGKEKPEKTQLSRLKGAGEHSESEGGKEATQVLMFYTFLPIVSGWHCQRAPCPQHVPVLLFLAGAAGPTTGAQNPTWTPQIPSPNTLSLSAHPWPQNSKWEPEKSKPNTKPSHGSRYFEAGTHKKLFAFVPSDAWVPTQLLPAVQQRHTMNQLLLSSDGSIHPTSNFQMYFM